MIFRLIATLLASLFVRALALALVIVTLGLIAPAYAADGGSPSLLTDTASWALLAGVFTPLLTSFAQQPRWSGQVRVLVAVAISLVVGIVTLLANGAFNDGPQTVLSVLAIVVLSSATAYKTIWQPSEIAPKIENATSPSRT